MGWGNRPKGAMACRHDALKVVTLTGGRHRPEATCPWEADPKAQYAPSQSAPAPLSISKSAQTSAHECDFTGISPTPAPQLTVFEAEDGWRYSLWVTNLPATVRGWRANPAYIDAAHRVHARVEDGVRTGKDTGLGKFPRVRAQPGVAGRRPDRRRPAGLAAAARPRRPARQGRAKDPALPHPARR